MKIPPHIERRLRFRQEKVAHIEPLEVACAECGLITPNGRSFELRQMRDSIRQTAHLKSKCMPCGLYQDPDTGLHTMTHQQIAAHFSKRKQPKRDK